MKRALLIVLALVLGALAVALLPRRTSQLRPPEPPASAPAPDSRTASENVQLSSTDASAPAEARHEEPAGPTQVYGWLTTADGLPADGGLLRLVYEDHSGMSCSAAEAHARLEAHPSNGSLAFRDARVQEDGGWVLDLPGKCWLVRAEYLPTPDLEQLQRETKQAFMFEGPARMELGTMVLDAGPLRSGSARIVRTRIAIEAPLEHGAREISFRVDRPLELRGIVVDGLGAPVANATIWPRMAQDAALSATSGKDGEFVLAGIPPEDLIVEEGLLEVRVGAPGFKPAKRLLAVGTQTTRLPEQRFVLWRR